MSSTKIICPIIIAVSGIAAKASDTIEINPTIKAEIIAEYLSSLSKEDKEKLGAKLYHITPSTNKDDLKIELLEDLLNQGRVKIEENSLSNPRTVSSESGI